MAFLANYGLFLAKSVTIVIAILIVVGGIAAILLRDKNKPGQADGHLEIKPLHDKIQSLRDTLRKAVLDTNDLKAQLKTDKTTAKKEAKAKKASAKQNKDSEPDSSKSTIYVIDFNGDIKASAVYSLREEITAILSIANASDEVVLRLESQGGMVHAYGLAASQLQRLKDKKIKLTVCVDKVAASGGYMMACVADNILAAPFAVLGSIGVVAQLPNFHKILKKHDIDYELMTAGEYKRTLTMLGENTEKGRNKFQQDLEDTHLLFKDFVQEHRPVVDISEVATGEIWFGQRAIEKNLVDDLKTSDEFLSDCCDKNKVYEVKYVEKKPLQERLGLMFQSTLDGILLKWLEKANNRNWFS